MSIYLGINGTQITNFIISTPFKDTIDEELDNFNFQIKSETRLTYKKNDRVVYSLKQGSTTILQKVFCIFNIVETWEGEKWLYQISCLSPTKLLENIIINGLADTYASVRFDLQLDRVREKINAQLGFEMAVAPVLSFDSSISSSNTTLYQANSSDFLWDGQVNVREIFNDKKKLIILAFILIMFFSFVGFTFLYVKHPVGTKRVIKKVVYVLRKGKAKASKKLEEKTVDMGMR